MKKIRNRLFPEKLILRFFHEILLINYIKSQNNSFYINKSRVINIHYTNIKNIKELIANSLIEFSKNLIIEFVNNITKKNKISLNSIRVKKQKTIWGSCSENRNINLNYKIIFLPSFLAKHIILHEICHLTHMDHSNNFWHLLSSYDPACLVHDHMLKKAEVELIPKILRE